MVSPLFLTLGFTGLLLELYTPGWGVPGTLGLLSLGLYFGGHLFAGLAGWWILGLIFLGVLLLLLELLVIPGFGVVGIGGIIAILASIVLAAENSVQALISLAIALGATVLLVGFLLRYLTKTKRWQWFVLTERLDKEQGYTAPQDLQGLAGKEGVALTPPAAGRYGGDCRGAVRCNFRRNLYTCGNRAGGGTGGRGSGCCPAPPKSLTGRVYNV